MYRLRHVLWLVPIVAAASACQRASASPPPPVASTVTAAPAGPVLDTPTLVQNVKASVVNIMVEQELKRAGASDDHGSPFEFFFRNSPGRPDLPHKQRALGTGFIFDDQGHVLTNAHVVEGADVVKVKLADERELRAKVKGRDERLDVAVLEIEGAKGLPHVNFGSSNALRVGESVVAIGNPFGLGHTVTTGIVSAKGRAIGAGAYDDFIQTDASINPGNSGGPLFDTQGRVVGMNTAINPNGQGIGFAIPSDEIKDVLPQLVSSGRVSRGRLGVHIQDVDQNLAGALGLGDAHGALVGDIEQGGPAAQAGLAAGDVVVRAGGEDITHARDLSRAVAHHPPGTKLNLVVRRGKDTKNVSVTLAKLDDEPLAKNSESPESSGKGAALGLQVGDAEGGGALVQNISPDSPAAGSLAPGDVIVEVDRKPVTSARDLRTKVGETPKDKPLLMRVKRNGGARWVVVERT
jgi:serine protease Do